MRARRAPAPLIRLEEELGGGSVETDAAYRKESLIQAGHDHPGHDADADARGDGQNECFHRATPLSMRLECSTWTAP